MLSIKQELIIKQGTRKQKQEQKLTIKSRKTFQHVFSRRYDDAKARTRAKDWKK